MQQFFQPKQFDETISKQSTNNLWIFKDRPIHFEISSTRNLWNNKWNKVSFPVLKLKNNFQSQSTESLRSKPTSEKNSNFSYMSHFATGFVTFREQHHIISINKNITDTIISRRWMVYMETIDLTFFRTILIQIYKRPSRIVKSHLLLRNEETGLKTQPQNP